MPAQSPCQEKAFNGIAMCDIISEWNLKRVQPEKVVCLDLSILERLISHRSRNCDNLHLTMCLAIIKEQT